MANYVNEIIFANVFAYSQETQVRGRARVNGLYLCDI